MYHLAQLNHQPEFIVFSESGESRRSRGGPLLSSFLFLFQAKVRPMGCKGCVWDKSKQVFTCTREIQHPTFNFLSRWSPIQWNWSLENHGKPSQWSKHKHSSPSPSGARLWTNRIQTWVRYTLGLPKAHIYHMAEMIIHGKMTEIDDRSWPVVAFSQLMNRRNTWE